MKRVVFWVLAAAALSSSSGCLLLYYFQNDPERLPCDCGGAPCGASEVADGKCLKGYVCVNTESGDADNPVLTPLCLKAGAKQKGDECARTEECDENLVCATRFASCAAAANAGGDDFNCDLVPDAEKKLGCRPVCDPVDPTASCTSDESCVNPGGGATPFCQTGTCTGDSDCNAGNSSGFCVSEGNPPHHVGLCFEACQPLLCSNGQCPDCKGVDGLPDQDANCVPVLDEVVASATRTMCDVPGDIPPGVGAANACNVFGPPCQAGSFCNCNVGNCQTGDGFCTKWCHLPSGNPACDAPLTCHDINGSEVGFCD